MALPPETPRLLIHADESCLGNQFMDRDSPGGAAGLVEHWRGNRWERRDYWLSEPGTTNNRMALRSAIAGLSALRTPCRIHFISDSQYLVKGMNEWIHGWKKRGWKRKAGPIENVELWKELDRVVTRHEVVWAWVKGHAGHPRNEYVNDLAIRAAKEQTASDGLVPSGFEAWLRTERESRGRYRDFDDNAPPGA
jgi:ribonuclease HI